MELIIVQKLLFAAGTFGASWFVWISFRREFECTVTKFLMGFLAFDLAALGVAEVAAVLRLVEYMRTGVAG